MHRRNHSWAALGVCLCVLAVAQCRSAQAAEKGAPFTVEDLVMLKRISDPQVSPDGRYLAFVQRETDLAANRGHTSLWLMALAAGAHPLARPD